MMMTERCLDASSVRHLKTVFKLCDPSATGYVHLEHLQDLAKAYMGENEDVEGILELLDPKGRGMISFREFCSGVRAILRRRHLQEKNFLAAKDSMMSPNPVATTTEQNLVGESVVAAPEPRFVISPPESPRPADTASKSQCSSLSDGENYECYGEAGDIDLDSGISSSGDRTICDGPGSRSPVNGSSINRHTWLRTSLRRTSSNNQENLPNRRWGSFRHSGKRQLGSNALASQLYRSSSFNSSGRSSTCDTADDMYSDASLEEDVLDLNHKVQLLQQQVGVLADSANHTDERYTRAKADNAGLQARVLMLEEQLRDTEFRHEERLQDEQKRSRELVARVEREKQLQLENCSIRLHAAELEMSGLREEVTRQRARIEKLEDERRNLQDQLDDARRDLTFAKEETASLKETEKRLIGERDAGNHLIDDLSREVERLRAEVRTPALPTTSPEALRLEELHDEVTSLRTKNSQLLEANEELQASLLSAGVEQGRLLTAGETSLAAELSAMTHDQNALQHNQESFEKIQQALKEQQDVNSQLRSYIDGILLNIVENYPQLLEVKHRST